MDRKEPRLAVEATRPLERPVAEAATALTWRCINTIRVLAMDAVEQAQSGHPGTPMALAPAAWLLWTRYLKYDPAHTEWPDRDRFELSCGHASMLLYSLLHLTGYDLPLEEIRRFRQWGSKTPGHAGRRDHDRPAGPGPGQRRRHGDRRAPHGRPVQPSGARDRQSSDLGIRQRRRHDGGRAERGRLPGGPPAARAAQRHLRRQPHHHRRRDVALLLRGRGPTLRGLWLAGASRPRWERPRGDRPGAWPGGGGPPPAGGPP